MEAFIAAAGDPLIWSSLITLTILEIVLGIDNLIFISVVSARLPVHQQARARRVGLSLALIFRIALLASIVWIVGLTQPIFTIGTFAFSWRDAILFGGGLFLLAKGTMEIHATVEGEEDDHSAGGGRMAVTFAGVIGQVIVLDIVFSLDSIITAVGMTQNLPVMIIAVVIAIIIMMIASEPVSNFIQRHPTTKMLALSFLLLVGMALVADGLHFHLPREYLYFAIAFSMSVEVLNLLAAGRRRRKHDAELDRLRGESSEAAQ
ncbi:MAG: TerC family protein [Alphaproteobacteria bacterium]|jgi:predicted tellurium resistance membrane protein TerC